MIWKKVSHSIYGEERLVDDDGRILGGIKQSYSEEWEAHCRLKTDGGWTLGEYESRDQARAAVDAAVRTLQKVAVKSARKPKKESE